MSEEGTRMLITGLSWLKIVENNLKVHQCKDGYINFNFSSKAWPTLQPSKRMTCFYVIPTYSTEIYPRHIKQKCTLQKNVSWYYTVLITFNSVDSYGFWYYHSRKAVTRRHGWCPGCQRVFFSGPGGTVEQKGPRGNRWWIPKKMREKRPTGDGLAQSQPYPKSLMLAHP